MSTPAPVDGRQAHANLLAMSIGSCRGCCWKWVWEAYAQAGARTSMGSSPTALAGWNLTLGRHPGDWNPPPGAAIWLGERYDGNQDGDVFIAGAYDGDHAATDQPTWGVVGRVSIADRIALTGRTYLGWSDHVLDVPISSALPAPVVPPRMEEPMYLIWSGDSGPEIGWLIVGAAIVGITSQQDYDLFRRVINSDQSADIPEHFLDVERDTIAGYLAEAARQIKHS